MREFMAESRSVVVPSTDLAWCAGWTPFALRDRFATSEVTVEETREVYVGDRAQATLTIADVVDGLLRGDTTMRWKGLDFLARVPAMLESLRRDPSPVSALVPRTAYDARSTLWVAPARTMSSLHHDGNFDNLNLQVSGKKLWLLIPPPQHAHLYLHGTAESAVNPFAPDLRRFPRFAGATPVEATTSPGDVLLVPRYWWHCVYAAEPSVNLATCFRWRGELPAWRALEGAPIVHRSLTVLSAELKRRGFTRLASVSRNIRCKLRARTHARIMPQPRTLVSVEQASARR